MDDRGGDSWGYYQNDQIIKGLGTAARGVDIDELSKGQSLILHTRKATVGEKTIENAHPWRIGNLVGLHNGGVSNHHAMSAKYKRNHLQVDSQHIFAHISEDLPLSELSAYGTIVYTDTSYGLDTIWTQRFNGGVLSAAGIKDLNQPGLTDVFFCSLSDALISALDMAKVDRYVGLRMDEGVLYHITDGMYYGSVPEIKLPFSARHSVGMRRMDFDLEYVPFSMNPSRQLPAHYLAQGGNSDNVRRFSDHHRATGRSVSDQTTKNFVRTRKGLEAYYKTENCSYCDTVVANIRVPTTELFYCIPCWEHMEQLAGLLLDKTKQHEYLNMEPVDGAANLAPWSKHPIAAELVESEEDYDDSHLCENCNSNTAVWADIREDELLCTGCKEHRGLSLAEIAYLPEALSLERKSLFDNGAVILPEPATGRVCNKCSTIGRVWYLSPSAGKYLWVCLACFNIYDRRDSKPIQVGIKKISAFNPERAN